MIRARKEAGVVNLKKETVGMIFIFITVFLWSTIEVVSKIVNREIPGMTIAFLRFTIGGLFLLPMAIGRSKKKDLKRIGAREWISLLLLSLLGVTLTFSLYHKALEWITATSVATLVSMVPIFIAPVALVVLKEKPGIVQVVGLIVGVVGIFLIFFTEESNGTSIAGILIMVLAAICFSIFSVFMKKLNTRIDPVITTSLSLLFGGIMIAPFTLLDGAPLFRPMGVGGYISLGYLGFAAVGLSYLFYFLGLQRTKMVKGNSLLYLKPILAGGLAWVVLGDEISLVRIISVVLITLSIYFVIRGKGKRIGEGNDERRFSYFSGKD